MITTDPKGTAATSGFSRSRGCLLVTFVLTLSGCWLYAQSKYAPYSDWGRSGYRDIQMDATTFQVTFCGNAMTAPDRVEQYALFRCADLTVQHGYDYFVVLDGARDVSTLSTEFAGPTSTSIEHDIDPMTGKFVPVAVSSTSLSTVTQTYHSATKTIRMFHGDRPAANVRAYDARSMMTYMGPQIER